MSSAGRSRLLAGAYRPVETILVGHTRPSLRFHGSLKKGSTDQYSTSRKPRVLVRRPLAELRNSKFLVAGHNCSRGTGTTRCSRSNADA
jgi:hypothetical protein